MIILIPVVLLLITSAIIYLQHKIKPNFAVSFTIASGSLLAAWLIMLILRFYLPSKVQILNWIPNDLFQSSPFLLLDYISWPYAFSLVTLCLAVLFTDSARMQENTNPTTWSGSLAITSIGLIAIMAGNPTALVIAWVLVDIIEFVYLIGEQSNLKINREIVFFLGTHFLSTIIFIWGTNIAWQKNGAFTFESIPIASGFYFLLAAGLRLGVIPLNFPFLSETKLKRGSGTLVRLAPVASSLVIINRLPSETFSQISSWIFILKGLVAIAAIYGSIKWVLVKDEYEGRPYWIITLAAYMIFGVLNGTPESGKGWGITLILTGGLLFLYYPQIKRIRFLVLMGLIGLSGLPFTPSASGWKSFLGEQFNFWSLLLILSHLLLMIGYFRHTNLKNEPSSNLETWAKITFPLGLIFILQSHWIIGLGGWPGSIDIGNPWISISSLLIFCLLIYLILKLRNSSITILNNNKLFGRIESTLSHLDKALSLRWFYKFLSWFFSLLSWGVSIITQLLEGEGGILWTFIILFLVLSLLLSGNAL